LKQATFISAMILVIISLISNVPIGITQSESVEVLSYSWYISNLGTFVVVGEVQNVGQNNIEFIALSGIVYSTDGNDEAWSQTTVYSTEILPQQKAPFVMYFFREKSYSGSFSWATGNLNNVEFGIIISNETDNYQYPNLEFVNSESEIETDGTFTITGNILNTGTQTAGRLWVVASFYNATGHIIATGFSDYLTPDSLQAGQTTSFSVNTVDAIPELRNEMQALAYKIKNYSLLIQTEAPIIPEFPSGAIILFTITSAIVLFYKKKTKYI